MGREAQWRWGGRGALDRGRREKVSYPMKGMVVVQGQEGMD